MHLISYMIRYGEELEKNNSTIFKQRISREHVELTVQKMIQNSSKIKLISYCFPFGGFFIDLHKIVGNIFPLLKYERVLLYFGNFNPRIQHDIDMECWLSTLTIKHFNLY